ncbi:hypothetical protein D3C76_1490440 [compost metagenome]
MVDHRLSILLSQQGRAGNHLGISLVFQQIDPGQQIVEPFGIDQATQCSPSINPLAIAGGLDDHLLIGTGADPDSPVHPQLGEILGIDVDDGERHFDARRRFIQRRNQLAVHRHPLRRIAHYHGVEGGVGLDYGLTRH